MFFEENGSEKGWVVSLQVNESDFRKTEISSQISHKYEKSSLREHFTEVVLNDARNPLIWANLESSL